MWLALALLVVLRMMVSTKHGAMGCDSNVDTILTLPRQTGSYAIAAACRDTALAFINESQHWGKAELAMWLMGPYAQVTQYVQTFEARQSGEFVRPVPLLREIDARMVDRVIRSARTEVLETLQGMANTDNAANFAFTVLSSGFVVRCEDARRVPGWVPSPDARRLADRVLSLFAADYMTRPSEYETELSICEQCGTVDFDAIARLRGICHRHNSGMFAPKSRRSTIPYMPEGA
jgi:hypothetical protein